MGSGAGEAGCKYFSNAIPVSVVYYRVVDTTAGIYLLVVPRMKLQKVIMIA
jgi:hypothetical protein